MRSVNKKELAFELFVYAISVIISGLLWGNPIILTLCYIIISTVMLKKWHTKYDFFYYFTAFFLGTLGETVSVLFGAWSYAKPFYIVPLWLPFLWGIAALFMIKISETLLGKK